MADTGIFATTAEVQYKAGANCSTTANSETYINSFMAQAESYINAVTKINYSDTYTSLNADKKAILKECASNLAAMYVIQYDMSGMALAEAQTRLDVLWSRADKCLSLLKEKQYTDFISAA